MKLGGELQPVWTSTQVPLFSPGFAIFAPASFFGVGPFAAFGPGTPVAFLFLQPRSFFKKQIPNRDPNFENGLYAGPSEQVFNDATSVSYRHLLWSGYVQDQWKARSNLSFTFGLRYDVDKLPSGSELKQVGGFHPTNYNNIQPRASFAYAFHGGKGVVRSGFGLFIGPFIYSDILVSWVGASEFSYMNQPLLPEFSNPSKNLIGIWTFRSNGSMHAHPRHQPVCHSDTTGSQSHLSKFRRHGCLSCARSPDTVSARLCPKRISRSPCPSKLAWSRTPDWQGFFYASVGVLMDARLHGCQSIRVSMEPRSRGCDPAVTTGCKAFFAPLDPGFGFVLYVRPIGFSIYNAGTVSLRKAFSHHFNFLANYTYAKSIDISTTVNLPNTPGELPAPGIRPRKSATTMCAIVSRSHS